ncbi:MAG: UvrD-helicase domain-containing protein [Lachnoclostridium sp.]|nr:UvrD-helicase domain-containing protein [Lachnoclostridium sp.]
MDSYLDQLNPQQREAVEYLDGPQLVIAGAGSGKTRVLTYKIVHLLNRGYDPRSILALTFTNKAAREMGERIERLTGSAVASQLWMGTFHSMFSRILRTNAEVIGFRNSFTIYDSADSRSLIKTIIKDMNLDEKRYTPAKVQSEISWAKNALITPQKYAADQDLLRADEAARRPEMHAIYTAYCNRCHAAGAMDFDDLLMKTYELFDTFPDILERYRRKFQYVLVDEYQDTNVAQARIVNQLCGGRGCLTVVGDDAQSIYSFRGANIANILELDHEYTDLKICKLERNYRSTQNIINAAGSLIDKNEARIDKKVYSEKEAGERLRVVEAYTDMEEARLVASAISTRKMRTGDSYDDFAILYRTNAQSRVLEEALRTRNIPYRIYGGLSFYQRKEIKDVIAYFRLTVNPDDDEALRRVINYPLRGIGDTTVGKLSACAMEHNVSMWKVASDPDKYMLNVNNATKSKLSGFVTLISRFFDLDNRPDTDAFMMTKTIINDTGIYKLFQSGDTPENISRRENIDELLTAANTFVQSRLEQDRTDIKLIDMLGEVSLATDQDSDEGDDDVTERVVLMTAHAAKGLEFNNVYIVGVEENLFPSAMSADSAPKVEEERRLLYVAITRARNYCSLSYAKSRFRMGMMEYTRPSRFLADIDPIYLSTPADILASAATGKPRTPRDMRGANPMSLNQIRRPSSPTPAPSKPTPAPSKPAPAPSKPTAPGDFAKHTVNELKVGQIIRHLTFGQGQIIDIDAASPDARILVRFDSDNLVRTLLLKYAKFTIL